MPYDFGDIVLVPFPFTSQTTSKRRPAVVVSRRSYNTARPDVVVMAITSQVRLAQGHSDAVIREWETASLLKPSVVKPVFATIEQALVLRRLGRLSEADQASLRQVIAAILGIGDP